MLRERTSEQIRDNAIKMGVKKAKSGCLDCMDGYFTLAKQHGATEVEIQQALEESTGARGKGLSRRELIKLAVASGIAVGAAGLVGGTAHAISTYWGTDSASGNCCGMPYNFYIGRFGVGQTADQSGSPYFNISAANAAGFNNTFGYWGVQGPGSAPSGMSAYSWGQAQATAAWNAWGSGPFSGKLGGYTVFGDLESGFGGWSFGNYGPNQQVVNGFLSKLWSITPTNVFPGLYSSPYYWSNLFGTAYSVGSTSYVLWVAGCDTCGSDLCSPCASCNTISTVTNKFSSVASTSFGGYKAVIWQYWIDPGNNSAPCYGCGDFDVASQHTNSFQPVSGSTYATHC